MTTQTFVLAIHLLIEFVALQPLVRQRGRAPFHGLPRSMQAGVLIAGAVSATSWYGAFALGITRELIFAVSSGAILASWA